jgi:hypothetical protein
MRVEENQVHDPDNVPSSSDTTQKLLVLRDINEIGGSWTWLSFLLVFPP